MDEIEQIRKETLLDIQINFSENITQLSSRFCNEVGQHETLDRIFVNQENFYDYIVRHPYVVLDPKLFKLAYEINDKMAELYQLVGEK